MLRMGFFTLIPKKKPILVILSRINNMKKRNIFNLMFHYKELVEQKERYIKCQNLIDCSYDLQVEIDGCKTLVELLHAHKDLWNKGFQNFNLGPCSWGMFRTKSIPEMHPSEVFLGGIWGLSTRNIPFWEAYSDEDMSGNGFGLDPSTKIYDLIMNQYRRLLWLNVEDLTNQAKDYVREYEREV